MKKDKCPVKIGEGIACPAKTRSQFYCTRTKGHKGNHHAHEYTGWCCAVWRNELK